jgi:predicted Zn-dependent peptidase
MEPTTDEFFSERLDSGVQVVGQRMSGVQSAAIGVLVGTGARDEEPQDYGISHFTEQMLFRGTQHLDARELSERFDSLGISHDSSAGLEMTLVNAVLLGDKVPAAIDLLADVVRFPAFPEEAVNNVRTLLLQELGQREDRPPQKVMDLLRQRFFAGSPLGHDVLGSEESLRAIGRDDLQRYWERRYTANNILISIAGNFDWPAVVEQLQRVTDGWSSGAGRMVLEEPSLHTGFHVIHSDKRQQHIGFIFPGVAVADPGYYANGLFAQALGGSSNSRLFREVREKRGLAYAVQARFDGMERVGLVRIYAGTQAERAHESVEVIMEELRKAQASGMTEEELRLSKTRLKSQLVMRSESTSARMFANLRSWWFEQELHSLEEIKERIDRVTLEDVSGLVQALDITHNLAGLAVGPRSEEELFGAMLARS